MKREGAPKTEDIELQLLLEAIYRKYHYDFRGYSLASIKRRLRQARDQLGFLTFSAMQEQLLHSEAMVGRLLDYLKAKIDEICAEVSNDSTRASRMDVTASASTA